VANWKTAEKFQRAELRTRRLTAARSLDEAEDLLDFAIALRGWPFEESRWQARERAGIARAWARLRLHYGTP
jgi:hypothetical protein